MSNSKRRVEGFDYLYQRGGSFEVRLQVPRPLRDAVGKGELKKSLGGDTLVVTRLDRLARSTADLLAIVATLEAKQVGLRILDFGGTLVDTKSPTGRMLLTMFAAVAEFERAIMLKRQRAGIAKAKAEGKYRGRVPTARRQSPQVQEMRSTGLGACAIADTLGISRSSVYRMLSEARP